MFRYLVTVTDPVGTWYFVRVNKAGTTWSGGIHEAMDFGTLEAAQVEAARHRGAKTMTIRKN